MEGVAKPTPLATPHLHTFIISMLIWTDSKDSWINLHTHTHTCTSGRVWSPSCSNDDVGEQSQTELVGCFKVYLKTPCLFSYKWPSSLFCAYILLSYLKFFSFYCLFLSYYPIILFFPSPSSSLSSNASGH